MLVENKNGYKLLDFIYIDEENIKDYKNVTSAGVVIKVNEKYLIGFNNWRKQWEIAMGGIEKGESAREAATRELLEEMHQTVKNMEFIGLVQKQRPTGEIVYSAIFYAEEKELRPFIKVDNDENDEIMLWNLKDDVGYVDEIDKKIIEKIGSL